MISAGTAKSKQQQNKKYIDPHPEILHKAI